MHRVSPKYAVIPLLIAFSVSLGYELWRSTAHAGESEYDAVGLWYIGFYGVGFGMAALAWLDRRGGWWAILIISGLLWLVGAAVYNPTMLMARNPGFVDHMESAVYMGLLMLTMGIALERLRLWGRGSHTSE